MAAKKKAAKKPAAKKKERLLLTFPIRSVNAGVLWPRRFHRWSAARQGQVRSSELLLEEATVRNKRVGVLSIDRLRDLAQLPLEQIERSRRPDWAGSHLSLVAGPIR